MTSPAPRSQAREITADRVTVVIHPSAEPSAQVPSSAKSATDPPYATALVQALAAKHGVALADVQGTGVGGRVRKSDVLAAAGVTPPPRAAAPTTARPGARASAFAANPLVDRARSEGAAGAGAAPTLFPTGDLPPWTASGIDPSDLLKVPAAARHPLAAAPTRAEALGILNTYQGAGAAAAAGNDFRYVDGNLDYEGRVQQWQASAMNAQQPATRSSELNPWLTADGSFSGQLPTDTLGG